MKLVKLLSLIALSTVFLVGTTLFVGTAHAQEREVTGTVTDATDDQPLPGVNIVVEGTSRGTTTNVEGEYSINVPGPEAVLTFSFVGYNTEEVQVGDQSTIDVQLQEDVAGLEEVVVVGYGTQRRRDISGSVSSVDIEEAQETFNISAQDMIKGRVSGVEIIESGGEPGGGLNVRIRGTSSISASSEPLYVIDGVPITNTNTTPSGAGAGGVAATASTNPLSTLSPSDIESIEILKDASATAIYGSQGANGVVLITTRGGTAGAIQADYSGKFSAESVSRTLPLLTGEEYIDAIEEFLPPEERPDLERRNTDWQDAVFRTGLSQDHNLSLSGGAEQTRYRASVGYVNREGIVLNSGLERVSGRVSVNHSMLDDRLRFDLNVTSSHVDRNHTFYAETSGFEGDLFGSMMYMNPTFPVRTEDGGFFEPDVREVRNPVALQEQIIDQTGTTRFVGNFATELDVLPSLTARVNLGADRSDSRRQSYLPRVSPVSVTEGGIARQVDREITNLVFQSTLNYERVIREGHRTNLLLGYEYKDETFEELGAEARDFVTDAWTYNNMAGGAEEDDPTSNFQKARQMSVFGRANYSLLDRYIFEATVRYDGASVFGEDHRWGVFPSGSFAWRLNEEPFLPFDFFSDLRLRASYGVSGNQAIPPYASLQQLAPNPAFTAVFGEAGSQVVGVAQSNFANPNLRWEQTETFNLGLDFLYGRFDGTLEFYRRYTTDLLLNITVPQPAVVGSRLENVGEMSNTGVEFSLSALVIDRNDFDLDVSGNISSNFNNVENLGERGTIFTASVSGAGQTGVDAQRIAEGDPIGTFYGPEFAGVNDEGQQLFFTEDGGTTTSLDEAERRVLGNAQPDFTYGFNIQAQYRGFDASAFFRGSYGAEIFNNNALEYESLSNLARNFNVLRPALTDGISPEEAPVYSSKWIEDGSYLRLDNLTVGYTLSEDEVFGVRRARVYFTAQNPFVITPYSGYDPEVSTGAGADTGFRSLSTGVRGVDYTNYPRSRAFTFGIELGI